MLRAYTPCRRHRRPAAAARQRPARTLPVLLLSLGLGCGAAAAAEDTPAPSPGAGEETPIAEGTGLLSCERFEAMVSLRDSPELERVLGWLQQTLNLLRPGVEEAPLRIPLSEVEAALIRYCATHPGGNILDGLMDYLHREPAESEVISA